MNARIDAAVAAYRVNPQDPLAIAELVAAQRTYTPRAVVREPRKGETR